MVKDNGGAIAQKGFNYQNAVISLVAIRNYGNENFEIYVETDEDFEVLQGTDYHAYIQVKGKKLSLTKMLKKAQAGKDGKKQSIIEKLFENGDNSSRYKVVTFNFSDSDLKEMAETGEELFETSYILSDSQMEKINDDKVGNFSVVITGFNNDYRNAKRYLIGEMAQQGISIDEKGDIVLHELFTLIMQKSEKVVHHDVEKQMKRITSDTVRPILQKVTAMEQFNLFVNQLEKNAIFKAKIKRAKNQIILQYDTERRSIAQYIETEAELMELSDNQIVDTVIKMPELSGLEPEMQYAVAISALCDVAQGV